MSVHPSASLVDVAQVGLKTDLRRASWLRSRNVGTDGSLTSMAGMEDEGMFLMEETRILTTERSGWNTGLVSISGQRVDEQVGREPLGRIVRVFGHTCQPNSDQGKICWPMSRRAASRFRPCCLVGGTVGGLGLWSQLRPSTHFQKRDRPYGAVIPAEHRRIRVSVSRISSTLVTLYQRGVFHGNREIYLARVYGPRHCYCAHWLLLLRWSPVYRASR